MKVASSQHFLDRCGMTVSGLCGIHCVGMVVLSLAQPVLAIGADTLDWLHPVEIAMAMAAAAFAYFAFVAGLRHHGHVKPVLLGILGLACIGAGVRPFHGTFWAPVLTGLGGSLMILAHRWNIRCRCLHTAHAT